MTNKETEEYRDQLRILGVRVQGTADGLEAEARRSTGGESAGNLSNTPMHLGDLGTESYLQELNATLFSNEEFLRDEISFALERIDEGTFGKCEECGKQILTERLEILPYTRYCVGCSEKMHAGAAVNINVGRCQPGQATADPFDHSPQRESPVNSTDAKARSRREPRGHDHADSHAAGTPGGGSAIGGLAGTTVGAGDPDHHNLENAMGSGNFDVDQQDLDEDGEDQEMAEAVRDEEEQA